MKYFLKKILLFSIPQIFILWILLFFYYVGYQTGEIRNIESLAKKQRNNHNIIIGKGYVGSDSYYKLYNTNFYQSDIIALGTSRVMQFHAEFFSRSFYNAGGAVARNYDQYLDFLKKLKYNPKLIILGLDIWVFNDNWNRQFAPAKYYNISNPDINNKDIVYKIFQDFKKGKWTIKDLRNYPKNYGFNGIIRNNGFKWDGTYYYGDIYKYPERQSDYQFKNTLYRIKNGIARFEWGSEVDDDTIKELDNLLKYCKDMQIDVIGLLTPVAPTVKEAMISSGNYEYINHISSKVIDVFSRYNFSYLDYFNNTPNEWTDDYYIDGFHGSSVIYGKMLLDCQNHIPSIKNYINSDKIIYLISNRASNLTID